MMLIIVGVGDVGEDGDDADDDDDPDVNVKAWIAPTGCIPIVKTKEELKFSSVFV